MMGLSETAPLAGWSTAIARDWKDTAGMAIEAVNPDGSVRNRMDRLGLQVQLAGWTTPAASDGRRGGDITHSMTGSSLARLVKEAAGPARFTASGQMLTGCSVGMESGGQLSPEHSRWLQGYPAAWGFCGATAMR